MLQEKYLEFQTQEQKIKQLQASLQNIDSQILELKSMQDAITDLQKVKDGSEVLMPVTPGMFVKGTITDSKKILVNVGSNVVVDKTIKETLGLLDKQSREVESIRQQFIGEMQKVTDRMQALEMELQSLVSGEE
ncbi:MAG: prefoldin alpha subunit [archaeon GW2011_AR3]|nr:MAG: prefoldin alpha subunit [archaeon GW2011_AR3]